MNIRPIELRDVAACRAIVRENWGVEPAPRFAAELSHVWSLDLDEEFSRPTSLPKTTARSSGSPA